MSRNDFAHWSLRDKVAQLFIVGFRGTKPDETVRELVEAGVGGVIYFARNVADSEQVSALSGSLQRTATESGHPPLLIAIDEEGGIVSRLPWEGRLPGQMTIGATRNPDLARRAAAAKARELRSVGINTNLAPVLDVNNNPDNPVIGVRSFGEDPELVSELGVAAASGFESASVVACGKHFPGHGDTAVDSHLDLPIVEHGRERLDRVELAPFRAAVDAGIGAIMTTHVAFPTVTEDAERPATLSESVLTGLLREELGYDGLVVTDCMEMNAIADTVGTPEATVQAVEAGCDLVTVSHTPETQRAAVDAIVDAVRTGRIDETRIDESVRRILRTKNDYEINATQLDVDGWADANDKSRRVGRDIAEQGVTLVRDRNDTLPVDDGPIRVVQFPSGAGSEVEESGADAGAFVERLRDRAVETDVQTLDGHSSTSGEDETPTIDVLSDETVIVCTRNASWNAVQTDLVSQVHNADADLVVLAIRNPYDLASFPSVPTYLTTYDDAPASLAVAADIVVGNRDAVGSLPVTIPTG